MFRIEVHIPTQKLVVFENDKIIREYSVSTAKNGAGEQMGSEQTPRGLHVIRAKVGANCVPNTVFLKRRPTGEIYSSALREQFPDRDWMLTRILWLCGLEKHKNRFGKVDSMRRKIYIHGTPDETEMGVPGSRGCVRMRNSDIIELFDIVPAGTRVMIVAD